LPSEEWNDLALAAGVLHLAVLVWAEVSGADRVEWPITVLTLISLFLDRQVGGQSSTCVVTRVNTHVETSASKNENASRPDITWNVSSIFAILREPEFLQLLRARINDAEEPVMPN
jgi:hypothetical protein